MNFLGLNLQPITQRDFAHSEIHAANNIGEYDQFLKDTLRSQNFDLPLAVQEILIERTNGKIRRVHNIPERKHMYDQVCYTLALKAAGVVVPDFEMTVALQLGHDLLEDIFESVDDLRNELHKKMRPSPDYDVDQKIEALLINIYSLTYKVHGRKIPRFSSMYDFHYHIILHGTPSAAFVRGTDTIQNTATMIGLPGKSVGDIAEELDQKSMFLLHNLYPDGSGQLQSYRHILGNRYEKLYEAFDIIRGTIQDLILLNRTYQENLPEMVSKRKFRGTGFGIEKLDDLRPRKGLGLLPEGISPTSIVKTRIAEGLLREYVGKEMSEQSTYWIQKRLSLTPNS